MSPLAFRKDFLSLTHLIRWPNYQAANQIGTHR